MLYFYVVVSRLDLLTSGLLIFPLSVKVTGTLTKEFMSGRVRKEYIARCIGKFSEYVSCCLA